MADIGHEATDALIKDMEHKMRREYTVAAREVKKKTDQYLSEFSVKDATWRQMLADGEVTSQEYKNWRTGQIMTGKRWGQLQSELAENMVNANNIAHSTAYKYQPEVYALNFNYATYNVENYGRIDTAFTLYDKDTVERLMRDDPDLLPPPGAKVKKEIARNKDLRWNRQQVQSVMFQGIVQGESIDKLATRLADTVATRNYHAAVRYARTMTTNSQNAGRYNAYRRAKNLGVDLTIEWSATLDQRTRHDHRMLHGQRREVDEPFEVGGVKILYPADLGGEEYKVPQSMIWNCRCTLLAWVKGFEGDTVTSSPKMGDMTFEEWKENKTQKSLDNSEKSGILMMQESVNFALPPNYDGNFDDFAELSLTKEEQSLLDILNVKAKETGMEYGRVIGDDYDSDIFTSNLPDMVYIPNECFEHSHLRFYHAHTNTTMLSGKDFELLVNESVDSVSVKTINNDVFSVSVGNGYRPTKEEFASALRDVKIESVQYVMDYPDFYDWSENQRTYMAIREQGYLLARRFGWRLEGGRP